MLVVYICATLKISTGTPASRGPSATAGLLVYIALGGVLVSCDSVGFSALVGDFQLPVHR